MQNCANVTNYFTTNLTLVTYLLWSFSAFEGCLLLSTANSFIMSSNIKIKFEWVSIDWVWYFVVRSIFQFGRIDMLNLCTGWSGGLHPQKSGYIITIGMQEPQKLYQANKVIKRCLQNWSYIRVNSLQQRDNFGK